jgi:NAD(P)-dependent dehydrogenase (short-subunit alcohol dehydrogenase family)
VDGPLGDHASVSDAPLAGKVVAVTGSSSGIGAATAQAFAALGASVLVNSSRTVAEGEAVAAALPDARYVSLMPHSSSGAGSTSS